jgi:hypothetical protein
MPADMQMLKIGSSGGEALWYSLCLRKSEIIDRIPVLVEVFN